MVPNAIVGTPSQPPNETRQPVGIGIVDDRPGVHAVSDLMAKIQCLIKNALCLRRGAVPPSPGGPHLRMDRVEFGGISQKLIQMHGERVRGQSGAPSAHRHSACERQTVQIDVTLLYLRHSVREVFAERLLPRNLGDRQFLAGENLFDGPVCGNYRPAVFSPSQHVPVVPCGSRANSVNRWLGASSARRSLIARGQRGLRPTGR